MSKILACLDGSAVSAAVCDFAAWAGTALDAPLTLLHVLDHRRFPRPGQATSPLLVNREQLLTELAALDAQRGTLAEDQGRLLLDAAQLRVEEQQARCAGAVLQHGDLMSSLESLQEDFDLIVLGRQGEDSPPKRLIGRHLESAIRLLHRPLLVAGHLFVKPSGVLLAYDDSSSARKAVTWVANCRLFDGLACHLVTVGRDREERRAALTRAQPNLGRRAARSPPPSPTATWNWAWSAIASNTAWSWWSWAPSATPACATSSWAATPATCWKRPAVR